MTLSKLGQKLFIMLGIDAGAIEAAAAKKAEEMAIQVLNTQSLKKNVQVSWASCSVRSFSDLVDGNGGLRRHHAF